MPDFPTWVPFAIAFLLIVILIVLDYIATLRMAQISKENDNYDA